MKSYIHILFILLFAVSAQAGVSGQVFSTPPMLPAFIPLEDASVMIKGRQFEAQTTTGEDGVYRFENIPEGTYLIWAAARNHQPMEQPDTIVIRDMTVPLIHDFYLVPFDYPTSVFLRGSVYDASVTITIYPPPPVHPATITLRFINTLSNAPLDTMELSVINNPDGTFEFPELIPAMYQVKCTAEGYQTEYIEKLDLRFGPDTVYFYMMKDTLPENLVSGKVINAADQSPVSNATVSLAGLGPYDIAYISYTGEDGIYRFKSILPGLYELRAVARGFFPSPVDTIEVTESTFIRDHPIFMKPLEPSDLVTLHGYVFNGLYSSYQPVYPAYISLMRMNDTGDSLFYYTQNNPDGSYFISDIVPGRYTARCTAPGFQPQVIRDLALSPPDVKQIFMLLPEVQPQKGWITGMVKFDRTEQPVAGARIHFISESGIYRCAQTGNDGYYKAELPAGMYYISCVYQRADSSYYYQEYYDDAHSIADATPVMIYPGEVTSHIDFGIPYPVSIPGIVISGTVTDHSGRPLREALVRAVRINPPCNFRECNDVFHAWTDANGMYKMEIDFPDLTPVSIVYGFIVSAEKPGYKLEFYHEKPAPYLADILWTSAGTVFTDINFTLDPVYLANSISGTVLSESGIPIANTFIIASNANTGEVSFAFADRSGGYTLHALPAGYYYLLFTAPGHLPEFYDDVWMWEDATPVLAYGTVTGIDARLSPFLWRPEGGTLAGIVQNADNQPIEGVLISIKNADGTMVNYGLSDDQGGYSINGLGEGMYEILASKVGYASVRKWIEFNSSSSHYTILNIHLDEAATALPEAAEVTDLVPARIELLANYPNPFNPETRIQFGIPESQSVYLAIYDVLGRKICDLINSTLSAGRYEVTWDGHSDSGEKVSSGVYFYILVSGKEKLVKKMVLSK